MVRSELILRFGYGAIIPWVTRADDHSLRAIAGPDMAVLRSSATMRGENFKTAWTTVSDPIELGQMRYREPKRQTKDCHSEGDSGDRQQNLYCGFTPTDAAGPAFEWVRSPLSERGFGERASSLSVP